MGVLKSLGLSPAKAAGAKAIRRLFGRVMPAESDSVTASASASASVSTSCSDTDQTAEGNASNKFDNQKEPTESQVKENPDSSSRPSATKSQANATRTDQSQQHDAFATTELPATASDMASPRKQRAQTGDVDKENQPPNATQLSVSLSRLELQDDKAVSISPKPITPIIPAAPIFTDPAVVAERAMHMKFTEAALDMVSFSVSQRDHSLYTCSHYCCRHDSLSKPTKHQSGAFLSTTERLLPGA